MLISVCEGGGRRFEVEENIDGFVVSRRDLATGEEVVERLFRTAPAAFAYAAFSAAAKSCADRDDACVVDSFERDTLRRAKARFIQTRERLADDGVPGAIVNAWRRVEEVERRIRYH